MAKHRNGDGRSGKSGYRPLNEGYSPKEQKGYSPKSSSTTLPKAPRGGSGESSRPASSSTSGKK